MDFSNLHPSCYINKTKKIIPYTPEKKVKFLKYDKKIWSEKFPEEKDIDYKKLQLTNIGLYSIATPYISKNLILLIDELISTYNLDKDNITVTETNGGVGGFSIRLAKRYKYINIVEINKAHADIITNNLKVYNLENANIKIFNDDYLNVLDKIDSDIIICDPPWGGTDVYEKNNILLGFNNINVSCIINELAKKRLFKFFILMTPFNFDLNKFNKSIKHDIIIRSVSRHYFIVVKLV